MNNTKNNPLVSIILLNYNEPVATKECIESILKITYPNYEIILVDNGSKEDVRQFIPVNKKITCIQNATNLGYAEGNNVGFSHATGELILFLNNDTIVQKGFLEPLVQKLMSDKKIGAVQPKILQYPNKDLIDSVGSYFIPTGFLYHFGHNKEDQSRYNVESEVFTMKGACMLFKRTVLEKVGVFDKDYFAYFEETDLCQRVWIAGFTILYIPLAAIYHTGGQTSNKMKVAFVNYHSYKNRIFTHLKNLEIGTLVRVLPVHILLCEITSILYIFTLRFGLALAIQRALLWNIGNIGSVVAKRKKIAEIRNVTDRSYLPHVTKSVRSSYYYHLFSTALAGYSD